MRNRLYLLGGVLLVATVGGLLWWSPWEPRPAHITARVVALTGEARYSQDGKTWGALSLGTVLDPASVALQTHYREGSTMDIVLGKRPQNVAGQPGRTTCALRMFSNSYLRIGNCRLSQDGSGEAGEMELTLAAGPQILGILNRPSGCRLNPGEAALPRLVVAWTPTTESGQTVFILKYSKEVIVLSGSLALGGPNADILLNPGDRFNCVSGEISQLPQDAPERQLWP